MDKSIHSQPYKLFLAQLRRARQAARLSQAELAERLDETQTFVSKCERGERRLDIMELRTFCGAIGVSFLDFVEELDSAVSARTRAR